MLRAYSACVYLAYYVPWEGSRPKGLRRDTVFSVEEVGIYANLRFTGEAGVLYERPPIQKGADPGPPHGSCPIHGVPALIGISDKGIANVVRQRRGFTDRPPGNPKHVLNTGAIGVQR